MKKANKILAFLLVAALLIALLAACASSETTTDDSTKTDDSSQDDGTVDNTQDTEEPADADIDEEDEVEEDEEDEEDIVELVLYFYDFRQKAEIAQHVEDAINELTIPQLGVKLDIRWLDMGNYLNTFNLAMAGGEQIDILTINPGVNIGQLYANQQLLDLTELLPTYAPETYELMQDYLAPFTYDGKIYGLPTNKNFRVDGYIVMNKPMLEEMGLVEAAEACSSWSEYEAILAAVKDTYGSDGVYGVVGTGIATNISWLMDGDDFSNITCNDFLGASIYCVATDNDGNVSLFQEAEGYVQSLQMAKSWMDNGYYDPDAALNQNDTTDKMKASTGFSTIVTAEYGVETAQSGSLGFDVVCAKTFDGMIRTNNINSWGVGVPVTSQYPEKAVETINLIYTNAELMNLLNWGVEGVDYDIDADGLVARRGTDVYFEHDAFFGNNLLMTPLSGNDPDFYKICQQINDEAVKSPYLGFTIDTTGLDITIAALSAVYEEFHYTIASGYYTDELYQSYLDKLEDAGVQTYLDAIQSQLDAWMAANG